MRPRFVLSRGKSDERTESKKERCGTSNCFVILKIDYFFSELAFFWFLFCSKTVPKNRIRIRIIYVTKHNSHPFLF